MSAEFDGGTVYDSGSVYAASETIYAGVDIGGTKTAVVLSSRPPEVLSRVEFATLPERGPEQAIEKIKAAVGESLQSLGLSRPELRGVGVSCGGPLNRRAGVIQSPPNLPTWVDVPIKDLLEREFRVPCRVENDANAGAIAEHRYGAGVGSSNMVFLTMGTGLGAGIIINGRLYYGASDMAGEIGHVRLTRSGPAGYNKVGSAEGWASGQGMAERAMRVVRAATRRGELTSLSSCLQKGTLTAKDVGLAAAEGDAVAGRIVEATGRKLGDALAVLVDVLNPERIVIGGLAIRLGESLLAPAREALRREALSASAEACTVVCASLGERIGDVAAICVAMSFETEARSEPAGEMRHALAG